MLLLPASAPADPAGRPITVIYRFDDYSARSHTPTEVRIMEAFKARGLVVSFGVIPMVCEREFDPSPQALTPLDSGKARLLAEAAASGHLEVFMHGYQHQTHRDTSRASGGASEFAGLEPREQERRLREGRKLLEERTGLEIRYFAPPWNQYDVHTAKSLEAAGFTLLSARIRGPAEPGSALAWLPTTCGVHDARQAVLKAEAFDDAERAVIVTFHEYDFKELDRRRGRLTFAEFEAQLDWMRSRPDVRIRSFAQALAESGDRGTGRFLAASRYLNSPIYHLAPTPLGGRSFPGVYLSQAGFETLHAAARKRFLAGYLPWVLAAGAAAAAALRFLPLPHPRLLPGLRLLLPLLFAAALAYQKGVEGDFYPGKTKATAVLLGLAAGAWLPVRRAAGPAAPRGRP